MNITEILEATAREYATRKVASIRRADTDPDLFIGMHWTGVRTDTDGQPTSRVGLIVVVTREPEEKITITSEEADPKRRGVVFFDGLDSLMEIIRFSEGFGGILWLNAGQPRMMVGESILNAHRTYQQSVSREEKNKVWTVDQRELKWQQFHPVALVKGRKDVLLIDWLRFAVTGILQVDPDSA